MTSQAQEEVNKEWNAMAGEWDDLASKYRDGYLQLLWKQTKLDPHDGSRNVVDFGCGSGLLTEAMRRLQIADSSNSSGESNFICIDAAPAMIRAVKSKIQSGGWDNVKAYAVALASYETAGDEIKQEIDALQGTVDLIVASSVMSFVPTEDLPATMKVLGTMLKPGGIFCHSDWPLSDDHPNGFTEETANAMYQMGGLSSQSSTMESIDMGGGRKKDVLVGVAIKS
jgi:SAM-dependent methyltransferase